MGSEPIDIEISVRLSGESEKAIDKIVSLETSLSKLGATTQVVGQGFEKLGKLVVMDSAKQSEVDLTSYMKKLSGFEVDTKVATAGLKLLGDEFLKLSISPTSDQMKEFSKTLIETQAQEINNIKIMRTLSSTLASVRTVSTTEGLEALKSAISSSTTAMDSQIKTFLESSLEMSIISKRMSDMRDENRALSMVTSQFSRVSMIPTAKTFTELWKNMNLAKEAGVPLEVMMVRLTEQGKMLGSSMSADQIENFGKKMYVVRGLFDETQAPILRSAYASATLASELAGLGESGRQLQSITGIIGKIAFDPSEKSLINLKGAIDRAVGSGVTMEQIGKTMTDTFTKLGNQIPVSQFEQLNAALMQTSAGFTDVEKKAISAGISGGILTSRLGELSDQRRNIAVMTSSMDKFATSSERVDFSQMLQDIKAARDSGVNMAEIGQIATQRWRKWASEVTPTQFEQFKRDLADITPSMDEETKAMMKSAIVAGIVQSRLDQIADANRIVNATLGPVGRGLLEVGRSFFWLGLGSMFALMSLQRAQRGTLAVQAANLSYMRSLQNLRKAQKEYREAQEYGFDTQEEAQEAQLALQEAQMQAKYSQDALTQSIQNSNMAWLQLVFGTIPTFIRGTSDMLVSILTLTAGLIQKEGVTKAETVATLMSAGASNTAAKAATAQAVATLGVTKSLLLATAAASFLVIPLILSTVAMANASKQIAEIDSKFSDLKTTMGPGSPPIYEQFSLLAESLDQVKTPNVIELEVFNRTLTSIKGTIRDLTVTSEESLSKFEMSFENIVSPITITEVTTLKAISNIEGGTQRLSKAIGEIDISKSLDTGEITNSFNELTKSITETGVGSQQAFNLLSKSIKPTMIPLHEIRDIKLDPTSIETFTDSLKGVGTSFMRIARSIIPTSAPLETFKNNIESVGTEINRTVDTISTNLRSLEVPEIDTSNLDDVSRSLSSVRESIGGLSTITLDPFFSISSSVDITKKQLESLPPTVSTSVSEIIRELSKINPAFDKINVDPSNVKEFISVLQELGVSFDDVLDSTNVTLGNMSKPILNLNKSIKSVEDMGERINARAVSENLSTYLKDVEIPKIKDPTQDLLESSSRNLEGVNAAYRRTATGTEQVSTLVTDSVYNVGRAMYYIARSTTRTQGQILGVLTDIGHGFAPLEREVNMFSSAFWNMRGIDIFYWDRMNGILFDTSRYLGELSFVADKSFEELRAAYSVTGELITQQSDEIAKKFRITGWSAEDMATVFRETGDVEFGVPKKQTDWNELKGTVIDLGNIASEVFSNFSRSVERTNIPVSELNQTLRETESMKLGGDIEGLSKQLNTQLNLQVQGKGAVGDVIVNGPFYVRSDEDIVAIGKEIRKQMAETYTAQGGIVQ